MLPINIKVVLDLTEASVSNILSQMNKRGGKTRIKCFDICIYREIWVPACHSEGTYFFLEVFIFFFKLNFVIKY